jgi:hypothetical protein
MRFLFLPVLFACIGCTVIEQPSGLLPRWTTSWREAASGEDEIRIRDWRKTFVAALVAANKGHAAEVSAEGALLQPDAALAFRPLPNGMYRCRVIKLGAKAEGNLDYVSYPPFTCRVRPEHTMQRLTKLSGSQRYVGLLFPPDKLRQIFLGTLVLGDERRALQYGQDVDREVVGFVENIGPNRWRLVMPQPHFESQLDVMELVPTTDGGSQ